MTSTASTPGRLVPAPAPEVSRRHRRFLELHRERLRLRFRRCALLLRHRWRDLAPEPGPNPAAVIRDAAADRCLLPRDRSAETRFLAEHPEGRELEASLDRLEQQLAALLADPATEESPHPLAVLARLFGLGPTECDLLLLVDAVESDPDFARLAAYVQDDAALLQATPFLATELFAETPEDEDQLRVALLPDAPLRRYRLLELAEPDHRPAVCRALRMDDRVRDTLAGIPRLDERVAPALRPLPALPVTRTHEELAARLAAGLAQRVRPVNLHGPAGCGRRALAAAAVRPLGLQLRRLDLGRLPPPAERAGWLRLLAREAMLSQLALYLDVSDLDGPSLAEALDLVDRLGVLYFVASREKVRSDRDLVAVGIPAPNAASRRELWERALGETAAALDGELDELVEQFYLGPEGVVRALATAANPADTRTGSAPPDGPSVAAALWRACREQTNGNLGDLAQRISPTYDWDDIVLPEDLRAQLRELATQVTHRATVYQRWGFGRKLGRGRGVGALFAGPSGTGKTMAAEILARHLGLDLLRIDLAGVVNKYIGETEKNLRRIFQQAERSGAILFFDEAEALFGRRLEAKDSHDRFANIEIDYLLQCMEEYRGLSILATNRKTELDRAFLRRLRQVVDFPFPNAERRLLIWQKVLPPELPRAELDFAALARLELTGANIRNIALAAAFLAAEARRPLAMDHLLHATQREFQKIDKLPAAFDRGNPLALAPSR